MNYERRILTDSEIRVIPESRMVEGYALLFNIDSEDLGGFTESIDPRSLDGVIENQKSSILALVNHNETGGILARYDNSRKKNTLELIVDSKGLMYRFNAPETTLGNDLLISLERGDIYQSSFAFSRNFKANQVKREDGTYHQRITKFTEISDVSPVARPAYPETTASKRNLEEFQKREAEELELKVKEIEAKEQAEKEKELKIYYDNLLDEIKKLEETQV